MVCVDRMIRHGIFAVRPDTHPGPGPGRDRDVARVLDTLAACRFPWWRAIRPIRDHPRPPFPFPVEWEANARDGFNGYVSSRRMWLTVGATVQTIAHELAHVADMAVLSGNHERTSFGTSMSPWRGDLLDLADHHDDSQGHPHWWQVSRLSDVPWSQRPVEAFTVPWTRHYFNDPTYHYPERRFARDGHTWDDPVQVAAIMEGRPMSVFDDVDPDTELGEAAAWAAARGIVEGYEDGTLRPDEPVLRRHQLLMMYRQAKAN